jgi:alpha-2-macroglobulin
LQPHAQTVNNLPIRLYGVMPVQVEDPKTHLQPEIEMPDVLEPGTEVTIKVSEKSNRRMTYTLAVVDEGLLDLTRFRTPDLWKRFYAREALGVKTWDIYDQVIGAYGGKIERLLAVGGGDEGEPKEDDAKANRFKPVVLFFGPVTLDGGSNKHTFVMPQYIGSVKTMLVAGYEAAYGSTEKTTPVRKPLMLLATLPRVLGPQEKVKLPVTLFTQEPSIKNVKVEVKATGPLALSNESTQSITMNGTDMTIAFDLDVKSQTGVAKVEVTATSGKYKSTDVIEIDVRNPNPAVTKVIEKVLEGGQAWTEQVTPVGVAGTNSAVLEVSSLPPVNLGQRLKYLMQYPYGCIEQTTSSVFPQLYLDAVKMLNEGEKAMIQRNVRAGIERLKLFVRPDGGFAYWPGNEDTDAWGTTYAGHFLLEAEAKGYFVPNDIMRKWKKFQKNRAQSWRKHQEQYSSELIQAYRLYTLALAGDADMASMNRLRETQLPVQASWMLAAAYAKAGQPEAAKTLISKLPATIKPYQEMAYSYGSDERDKAIILETLIILEDRTKGFELLREISAELSNPNSWMSTQTIAWCLKAVGAYAAKETKGDMKFSYSFTGDEITAATALPLAQVPLDVKNGKQSPLKVVNNGKGTLFVRVIMEGTPARGAEEEASNNLSVNVSYMDLDGNPIDPAALEQGTQFISSVAVTNPGIRGAYKNLAINQIFPSGWEINNLRLDDAEDRLAGDKPTYQDIRDDRVYTYFDLDPGQRRTFRVLLTATYAGTFYLPAVSCEAMYDRTVYARTKGKEVSVIKPLTP